MHPHLDYRSAFELRGESIGDAPSPHNDSFRELFQCTNIHRSRSICSMVDVLAYKLGVNRGSWAMTHMEKVEAAGVPTAFDGQAPWEIVRVDYSMRQLTVVAQDAKSDTSIRVRFDDVVAYRVMDERDLGEYWPACSLPNGWVYSIRSGGWLSQESVRSGSCVGLFYPDVHEYLVAGFTDCVSVLCISEPRIELDRGNS